MRPGTSPRTVSSSSVTNCILTTYYRTCRAASPHQASLPRRSGADDCGHACKHLAGISCSPAVLDRPYHRTFPEIRFEFTPSQARQRWAERPAHPLLSLLDSVSYPSHIPPPHLLTIPLHRSAHRYYALWNAPVYHELTLLRCLSFTGVEAIALINRHCETPWPSPRLPTLRKFTQPLRITGRQLSPKTAGNQRPRIMKGRPFEGKFSWVVAATEFTSGRSTP
jgi:hypothetical protein